MFLQGNFFLGRQIEERLKNKRRKYTIVRCVLNKSLVNISQVSVAKLPVLLYFLLKKKIVAIVQGDTIEDIYGKAKSIIWAQSGPTIWVPSNENL